MSNRIKQCRFREITSFDDFCLTGPSRKRAAILCRDAIFFLAIIALIAPSSAIENISLLHWLNLGGYPHSDQKQQKCPRT